MTILFIWFRNKEKVPIETTYEPMIIVAKGGPRVDASVTKLSPSMLKFFAAFLTRLILVVGEIPNCIFFC